ncbi:MAG: tyrosine-type recombinase/integrase [Novosphingobium sp.]|uniref:tyrosine-type recombinase/integrase n=1 Tax=Novosphingobium sp. TaxID=1874826 RepID=UPI003B9D0D6F
MAKGITDRELNGLVAHPPAERMDIKDGTIDGLVVRAGPRGRPTWTLRFRVRGAGGTTERGTKLNGAKYHRVSLGSYPAVSIKAARKKALEYLAAIERGEDPIAVLEDQAVRRRDTVNVLVEEYLVHAEQSMRSWRNAKWLLNRHVVSAWGERPAGTITERDARKLVEDVRKGAPDPVTGDTAMRNGAGSEVRKWGSMLFEWARKHGKVKSNPFKDVPVPKLGQRQRFLSMEEAWAVWAAAGKLRDPWGQALRLLMLTGCRENEICAARWQWFDASDRTLTIPPEHYKSGRNFLVTLPDEAVAIIEGLPRWKGGDFLLSTTNGEKPIAGIARKVIDDLHEKAEAILKRPMARFSLHDLRRTVRTHLSRLGVEEVVAELVLGHALKGLQARYNVYGFADEKRAALTKWAQALSTKVTH